eukprot:m.284490 g.284490  ORF g.284490 m.284490 type:complete len:165 (-) comp19424_c0_seq3:101-595(-)
MRSCLHSFMRSCVHANTCCRVVGSMEGATKHTVKVTVNGVLDDFAEVDLEHRRVLLSRAPDPGSDVVVEWGKALYPAPATSRFDPTIPTVDATFVTHHDAASAVAGTKIGYAVKKIAEARRLDPTAKFVVFSEFVQSLIVLQQELERLGGRYRRDDGRPVQERA